MCELIYFGEVIGAFFAGIAAALGVLALLVFRWPRKAKKPSAHKLEVNRHFKRQG